MLCWGYVRVSTRVQRDAGSSLPSQRQRIEQWCSSNGHELVQIHADEAESGRSTDRRPGVQQAIRDACRGRGALVAVSLARVCRSTSDALRIAQQLDRAGASLVSLSEMIATDSASGRLVFRLLAALAEFEAELIAERTTTVLHHMRGQGRRVSGRLPFGFDLGDDGRTLVVNPTETQLIERMRTMRVAGMSYDAIAEHLSAEGIRTKLGRPRWMGKTIAAVRQRTWTIEAA